MSSVDILYFAVFWIVTVPLLTLLHELGHALLALAFTKGIVSVSVGNPVTPGYLVQVGRLQIRLRPFSTIFGLIEHTVDGLTSSQRAAIVAAGPVSTCLLLIILTYFAYFSGFVPAYFQPILVSAQYAAIMQTIMTGIPLRYPNWLGSYGGKESDGLRFLKAVRGN